MKKVVALFHHARDKRELDKIVKKFPEYSIIFEDFSKSWQDTLFLDENKSSAQLKKDIEKELDSAVTFCQEQNVDALISSLDYVNVVRAALSEKLGFCDTSLESVLLSEHKYYARQLEKRVSPDETPDFIYICDMQELNACGVDSFPCFAKPAKSYFSIGADFVHSHDDLVTSFNTVEKRKPFTRLFHYFLKDYPALALPADGMLIESCLNGYQTTVEGCVIDGQVTIFGVVDAVMFEDTICFKRFEYPSSLADSIQYRMKKVAERLVREFGLNQTLFNIEFMYDPTSDTLGIIEINPRIATQFADLYERVDGFNTYKVMLDIALGRDPELLYRKGQFDIAASSVLRVFEDKYVEKVPSERNIRMVQDLFPDFTIETLAEPGKSLSAYKQDGKSFRYGLIHLGAYDTDDLESRLDMCETLLDFRLKPF